MPASAYPLLASSTAADATRASEVFMDMSAAKGREFAGFDPHRCAAFLRARHPQKTAAEVAARTGDPVKTVERWLAAPPTTPSLPAFARLARAYGPAFVAAAIPGLGWVEHAAALATYDGLGREIDALHARRAAFVRALIGKEGS